jgi:hypothetical protein
MANGPSRHSTTRARARQGPMGFGLARPMGCSCHAEEAFVPSYWPRHGTMGRFSGQAIPMSPSNVAGRAMLVFRCSE